MIRTRYAVGGTPYAVCGLLPLSATIQERGLREQENWRARGPENVEKGERTRELENQRTREYGKEERGQENRRS